MDETLLDYKCPNCGGRLEFNSDVQQMKCPFCDSVVDVSSLRDKDTVLNDEPEDSADWTSGAGGEWAAGETDGMRVFVCQSCGGEIIGDAVTGATTCPYCDNPVVMAGSFSGALKPDYVIPFKLDKEAAKAALTKHLKGKKLLPKSFRSQNHIDEIKGIYVPFWLFDADVNADVHFKTTKVRHWSDARYEYTETSYFDVLRAGDLSFDRVPADGSSKMADDLMESIEPYDFAGAVPFQTAYLSGYLADKYDVDENANRPRVQARMRHSTETEFRKTVTGYSSVSLENSRARFYNGKTKYALYPVWILNTTWRDQTYTFAMNGQTGKFVGNLPMDKGAFVRYFLLTALGSAAAVFLLQWLASRL